MDPNSPPNDPQDTMKLEWTEFPGGPHAKVSGTIRDPGQSDVHTVSIDWGDGTPVETFEHPLGEFNRSHQYPPLGLSYTVNVSIADDDLGVRYWSEEAHMYLLDLDSDADNNGEIDEDDDPLEEYFPGAYVGVNADDDDESLLADLDEAGPIENENDLEEFRLRWTPAYRPEVDNYQDWYVVLYVTPEYTD